MDGNISSRLQPGEDLNLKSKGLRKQIKFRGSNTRIPLDLFFITKLYLLARAESSNSAS